MAEHEKLNIYSVSANGLERKRMFLTFLKKQSGNICLLQETQWTTEQNKLIRSQWGFECVVAGNQTGSRVVALLFKNNLYRVSNSQY